MFLFSDLCFSYAIRRSILRVFGAKIGVGVIIRSGTYIYDPSLLKIGNYSWVGDRCHLNNPVQLIIGNNVAIAHEVFIACGSHDFNNPSFAVKHSSVEIGDNCWIASRAFISPGVFLSNTIVLACALVPQADMRRLISCKDQLNIKPRKTLFDINAPTKLLKYLTFFCI